MNPVHAFTAFYRRHERFVRQKAGSCFRRFGDNGNGRLDDVVQTVFLVAFREFDSLGRNRLGVDDREDRNFLCAVTRLTVKNLSTRGFEARRISKFGTGDGETEEERWETRISAAVDQAPSVEDVLVKSAARTEQLTTLAAMLDGLTSSVRQSFILREVHGESYSEIAAKLGLDYGTVAHHVTRARKQMRAAGAARGLTVVFHSHGGGSVTKSPEAKERQRQGLLARWARWRENREAA